MLALKAIYAASFLFILIHNFFLECYARPVQICSKSPLPKVCTHKINEAWENKQNELYD